MGGPQKALAWVLRHPVTTRRVGKGYRLDLPINSFYGDSQDVSLKLYLFDNDPVYNDTKAPYKSSNSTAIVEKALTDSETAEDSTMKSGIPSYSSGGFGDIMSPKSDDEDVLFRDGLVTSSYSLAETYGIHHPLDRIAVTANGNLQRIFSSYYDEPVNVVLDTCKQTLEHSGEWERRVHLEVFDQTFCTADSRVVVRDPECRELVEFGKVGLGQLFRYKNVLPEFMLQAAGPTKEGGFWRKYTLECSLMICYIHEVFCPNVWDLKPTESKSNET